MAIKRKRLMCDFETTTDPQDCRVWAGCAVDIDALEVAFLGNNIDSFMEYLRTKNTVCYFHNLKFDGEFILHWLLSNGYKYSEKRTDKTFQCLITDDGLFYSIEVIFRKLNKKYEKVVFYDSLKKLPFKVAVIAKAFELQTAKGEIDYRADRPIGYEMTQEEKDYIITDCRIVAEALKIQFEQGLKKMTNASDALNGYKSIIGRERFEKLFPVLPYELDTSIRRAYKGGFVYLNPKHKDARGLFGKQYDVNSLYPWAMYSCMLPYGYPVFFEGEPEPVGAYNLFIVRIKCRFNLKPGYIPTIQLKNNGKFSQTEYLTTSKVKVGRFIEDDPCEIVLTSVDLKLFQEHYDIEDLEYLDGFYFKGVTGLFKEYIDHWMHIKETTTGALRQLAKLMLNSLYGKFASSCKTRKKIPYLDPADRVVRYQYTDYDLKDPVYTAMACFITAYAREKTIRSAQANFDRFIYADTDSLKLIGYETPDNLEIHPTALGAWKDEGDFTDSIFIRAKTYMMTVNGETKVTCAGMPDNVKKAVTYENFCVGSTFDGKLLPRRYNGGIVLEDTTFTIK